MCDHCVKRNRAYESLSADQRAEVDALTEQSNAAMEAAVQAELAANPLAALFGPSPAFDDKLIAFGDTLDMLLGIASAPEYPPDFA